MTLDLSSRNGDIAERILGPPNKSLSSRSQLRFGNNGSVAVEIAGPQRGQWYDHEAEIGGGPWEMLRIKGGLDNRQAEQWLHDKLGMETRRKTNGADWRPQRQKRHIVKTYDYHDEEGVLLFKVDRWGPKKTFSQRAPDGSGGWIKGRGAMEGVRRVLYRLPHLVVAKAGANGTPWRVYLLEGEKDVDNHVHWPVGTMGPPARWEWRLFAVSTRAGRQHRYGSVWNHWGVHRTPDKWFVVTHLPSGCRLAQFDRLRIARRFCEAIDRLADWSAVPEINWVNRGLALQVHRAALNITAARPALICIHDAE